MQYATVGRGVFVPAHRDNRPGRQAESFKHGPDPETPNLMREIPPNSCLCFYCCSVLFCLFNHLCLFNYLFVWGEIPPRSPSEERAGGGLEHGHDLEELREALLLDVAVRQHTCGLLGVCLWLAGWPAGLPKPWLPACLPAKAGLPACLPAWKACLTNLPAWKAWPAWKACSTRPPSLPAPAGCPGWPCRGVARTTRFKVASIAARPCMSSAWSGAWRVPAVTRWLYSYGGISKSLMVLLLPLPNHATGGKAAP